MRYVQPDVIKVAETRIDARQIQESLAALGYKDAPQWFPRATTSAENLTEFAGRLCYQSFETETVNPNVTKIREDPKSYFENIIKKGDGSIFEHASVSFLFLNVSRIFTHELVRHRVGTAISQESFRYIRPKELKLWLPPAIEEGDLLNGVISSFERSEKMFKFIEEGIDWEHLPFEKKKVYTSAMRRMLPDGMATNILWTANHRTLRHVIEMRTDPAAEVEIRYVFDKVGKICKSEYPIIYQDFIRTEQPDGTGTWRAILRSKL